MSEFKRITTNHPQRNDFSSTQNLKYLIPSTPTPCELRTVKMATKRRRTSTKISKKEMVQTVTEKASRRGRTVVDNGRQELASRAGTVVVVVGGGGIRRRRRREEEDEVGLWPAGSD